MKILLILFGSTLISTISSNLEKMFTEVETAKEKIEAYTNSSNKGRANSCDNFELYLKVPIEE